MNTQTDCLICERIRLIRERSNPYFVCELKTGYVVLGDHQFFRGYTLFLCKEHKRELHELEPGFRRDFLLEMSEVASAVFHAFQPHKLNYEMLGNSDEHMHWHLFPRYKTDSALGEPIWSIDKSVRCANSARPTNVEIQDLKTILCKHLSCK